MASMNSGPDSGLKNVNSERDLSLPIEKHHALENFYDSQEDGKNPRKSYVTFVVFSFVYALFCVIHCCYIPYTTLAPLF